MQGFLLHRGTTSTPQALLPPSPDVDLLIKTIRAKTLILERRNQRIPIHLKEDGVSCAGLYEYYLKKSGLITALIVALYSTGM
jgi:hypothetical protein